MKTPTHKAVVLARGLGTRMRREDPAAALGVDQESAAGTGVKGMIPVGRPFLDYVLSALADAGYGDICLVIGPEPVFDPVRRRYGSMACRRIRISFAVQEKALGTADAVYAARDFTGADSFTVINSDNYYPWEALEMLSGLDGPGLVAFEREAMLAGSNIPMERIAGFAVAKISSDGFLEKIIEKPSEDILARMKPPVYLSMNCWRFRSPIFTACRSISPSPRGELELPSAVNYAIESMSERFSALVSETARS